MSLNDTTVSINDTSVSLNDTIMSLNGTTVSINDTSVSPNNTRVSFNDTTVSPNDTSVSLNDTTVSPNDTTVSPNDTTVSPKKNSTELPDMELYYFENNNLFNEKKLLISGKFWNYIEILVTKLDRKCFIGFFIKTLSMFPIFKAGDFDKAFDYFRRCQLLAILQSMALIEDNGLPQLYEILQLTALMKNNDKSSDFIDTTTLLKIGPSKSNKKNCCLIDDSNITNEEDKSIRNTLGTMKEPHRGYIMYDKLSNDNKNKMINSYHKMFIQFENIVRRIKNMQYMMFDPISLLQRIVKYSSLNNKNYVINYLATEIHDNAYLLDNDEKLKLFHNYDNLKKLWDSNFMTNNHGKFRVFVLSIHFIDLIYRNQIKEIYFKEVDNTPNNTANNILDDTVTNTPANTKKLVTFAKKEK